MGACRCCQCYRQGSSSSSNCELRLASAKDSRRTFHQAKLSRDQGSAGKFVHAPEPWGAYRTALVLVLLPNWPVRLLAQSLGCTSAALWQGRWGKSSCMKSKKKSWNVGARWYLSHCLVIMSHFRDISSGASSLVGWFVLPIMSEFIIPLCITLSLTFDYLEILLRDHCLILLISAGQGFLWLRAVLDTSHAAASFKRQIL